MALTPVTTAATSADLSGGQVFFSASTVGTTAATSSTFLVNKEPWYLEAFNLAPGDVVTIQQVAGAGSGTFFADFAPLGVPVTLTQTQTKYRLDWPGYYRLVFAGTSVTATFVSGFPVTMTHESALRYITGGASGGGFTLTASDTNSVNLTYIGTTSAGTLTADSIISPDVGNGLTIRGNGLFSTAGGYALTANDTATIDLTLTGSTSSGTLVADAIISPDAGNIISAHVNGLYATGGGAFNMPDIPVINGADIEVTYSAYTQNFGSSGNPDVTINLINPATNSGQIYIFANLVPGGT